MAAGSNSSTHRSLGRLARPSAAFVTMLILCPWLPARLVVGIIGLLVCLRTLRRECEYLSNHVAFLTALEIAVNPNLLDGVADQEGK